MILACEFERVIEFVVMIQVQLSIIGSGYMGDRGWRDEAARKSV